MQLTRFTDLGLRALMRLAVADGDGARVTTRMIARQIGASEHHVAKAIARLVELGLVESHRGRSGGVFITSSGRTVRLGWLIRRLEGDGEVIECEGTHPCPLARGCRLRTVLARAQEAFYRELDAHGLDDLVAGSRPELLNLLITPVEQVILPRKARS